jgi:hypothetical protein
MRIHHRRFTKIPSRLGNLVYAQVIHPDAKPRTRLRGRGFSELVRKEKEFIFFAEFVEGAQVGGQGGYLEGV